MNKPKIAVIPAQRLLKTAPMIPRSRAAKMTTDSIVNTAIGTKNKQAK